MKNGNDSDFSEENGINDNEDNSNNEDQTGFTIIKEVKIKRLKRTEKPLPQWFRDANTFNGDIQENLIELKLMKNHLNKHLIKKLKENNIKCLFPVQATLVPFLIKSLQLSSIYRPRDVCISSATGTGKTLSYVLPIIEYFREKVNTEIRCLIVVPVHELALQVYQVFQKFIYNDELSVGLAIGDRSLDDDVKELSEKTFDNTFKSKCDILLATPGRLIDLIKRVNGFNLNKLKLIVLDEADRLSKDDDEKDFLREIEKCVYKNISNNYYSCFCDLNEIAVNNNYELSKNDDYYLNENNFLTLKQPLDIENICSQVNYSSSLMKPMKILLSATITNKPELLDNFNLFQPKLFKATRDAKLQNVDKNEAEEEEDKEKIKQAFNNETKTTLPESLHEKKCIVKPEYKPLAVYYFLKNYCVNMRTLCFTNTLESAQRLYLLLKQFKSRLNMVTFSSSLSNKERQEYLNKFRSSEVNIIITTDALARGIDVDNVECVISYDVPSSLISYVHRVGRTARAGQHGEAITLVSSQQIDSFTKNIISHLHSKEYVMDEIKLKKTFITKHLTEYETALQKLGKTVKAEKIKQKSKKNKFEKIA